MRQTRRSFEEVFQVFLPLVLRKGKPAFGIQNVVLTLSRQDCQEAGWKEKGHKADCKLLKDPDLQKMLQLDWNTYKEPMSFRSSW